MDRTHLINTLQLNIKDLQDEAVTLNARFGNVERDYEKLENRHDISKVFQGRWRLETTISSGNNPNPSKTEREEVSIQNDQYTIVYDSGGQDSVYNITLIDYDEERGTLTFAKYHKRNNGLHIISKLRRVSSDRFEGTENNNTVVYSKSETI